MLFQINNIFAQRSVTDDCLLEQRERKSQLKVCLMMPTKPWISDCGNSGIFNSFEINNLLLHSTKPRL